jgi:carboxypeptidase Taq
VRFEIERALLNREVEVKDLPQLWKSKMEELLNIKIKNDKEGLLQDVHWAMGEFGYFPSYALGNLYSAQILHTLQKSLDLDTIIESGDFIPIKEYLNNAIYKHGSIYKPKELLERVSGKPLSAAYFENYLAKKYLKTGE